ncbi:hypothetical protein [Chenggangzhangella methanolivorans]|uniref:hypothetical protein n=1 Tax=Chenggangzhangella methanolivorans TaxID=1437009 RepID=UPI003D1849EF
MAEGIERDEQAQMVRRLGCQIGQGFLYSKPQAADALFGQAAAGFSERAAPSGALPDRAPDA